MIGRVVHCKREPHDLYIGRPSRFGNPFKLDSTTTREEVLEKFEAYARAQLASGKWTAAEVRALAGKTLGCWCAPRKCHGDVLLKLAAELAA